MRPKTHGMMAFQSDKFVQKLCELCVEMFSLLPTGFAKPNSCYKNLLYHKTPESLQDSVNKGCAFCTSSAPKLQAEMRKADISGAELTVMGNYLAVQVRDRISKRLTLACSYRLKTTVEFEGMPLNTCISSMTLTGNQNFQIN